MGVLRILGPLLAALCAYYFYSQETISAEMMRGKRVLVTGSSTGIGEQMAYEFARMGAHVMVTARREEQLRQVVRKCLELGASSAAYVVSDMENLTSAQKVVGEAKAAFGRIPTPFSTTYAAAKFALEGFYSSLRTELRLRGVDLPITVAVLGYIDTDSALKLIGGKINMEASPKEDCAREIVRGGVLRKREVFYPYWSTKAPLLLRYWLPELLEQFISQAYLLEKIL